MFNADGTKNYKNNQTTIKLNTSEDDFSVEDLVGLGSSKEVTNAVELKRELYL